MKGIRQPTLADLLIASDPRENIFRTFTEKSIDRLRMSHKFVLDAQAATYLGKMIHDHPRVIADAQDFAIRPFDHMWVEFPFVPFFREVSGKEPDHTSDTALGYLFSGPTVRVGAHSTRTAGPPKFLPMEYTLHTPMSIEDQLKIAKLLDTSRVGIDLWFWGESAKEFIGGKRHTTEAEVGRLNEWDKEGMRSLRANHSVRMAKMEDDRLAHLYPKFIHGSGGDLRNIIALLLFLNRTSDVQYIRDVGMGQTVINRKPKPMLPHKVITLKLNPLPRLATLAAGSGIRRRLHDVRGHFCHDKLARAGCQHGTQEAGDWGEWWEEYEPLRWKCTHCAGKRWWKHEHQRGHQEVGVIKEQVYAVTK